MKASETSVLKLLEWRSQFIIPIYQRTYSWTYKQCEQLWKDIVKTWTNSDIQNHFIGGVVYIEDWLSNIAKVNKYLIIDGQQRVTTILLILFALSQKFEEMGNREFERIKEYYIFNSKDEWENKYKLIPTDPDRDYFIRILENQEYENGENSNIIRNYKFFLDKIEKNIDMIDEIYNGIAKLMVVDIALDRNYDNPQLIFESMNSTGLELSQADLIRNYLLMGLENGKQKEVYKKYWFPMEQSFGTQIKYFDDFIRNYLTIKSPSGTIPTFRNIYDEFKKHVKKWNFDIDLILADLYYYSKLYVKLSVIKEEEDKDIKEILEDIDVLKADVSYPLLLEIYSDYTKWIIEKEHFLKTLRLTESYVFRRVICGIPTNSLNKTFATFKRFLNKETSEDYYHSFVSRVLTLDSYRRFPDNKEFQTELRKKDIYNFRNTKYLLSKLENFNKKEKINVDNYTIEHILPQNKNLSEDWKTDLWENWKTIQEIYLHTIWNLTLTGYNSEYSDKSFAAKKNMEWWFIESPFTLNLDLKHIENWNEETINQRANKLSNLAIQVWARKELSGDIIERYKPIKEEKRDNYTINDYEHLNGEILDLFQELRKHILNISPIVKEEYKKLYIAYKADTNFVDIVPQKVKLRLSLNMNIEDIKDPKWLCKDITNLWRWGNGNVEVGISDISEIEYIIYLIEQSFDKQINW